MQQIDMPLPITDYQTMNCDRHRVFETIRRLPQATQLHVNNATHRLAEVDWITCKLEDEIKRSGPPRPQEGLLSLQIYLLLTCADTLGHVYVASRQVRKRFREFFENLPQDAKQNLVDGILTWRTNFPSLVNLELANACTNQIILPSRQQILQSLQPLTFNERFDAIVGFLYLRRNVYTHESRYPQLGYHPGLSVMQNLRLHVPNTTDLGEFNRLQAESENDDIYFAFYKTDDVVATIRWSILRGLGRVIGTV
jgi:hypothetical protein